MAEFEPWIEILLERGPVLATCGIRSQVEAFDNTLSRLLLVADSEEGEYNRKRLLAHLHKGVTTLCLGFSPVSGG